MIWSISDSKIFRKCQRQWFYKGIIANGVSKDPGRHRVYLLSKLQSISAWRGQIVDSVISEIIIPAVASRRNITLEDAKRNARDIFSRQLKIAREHNLWKPDFSPRDVGDDFVALHCMEYTGRIDEDELKTALEEIDTALENLFLMTEIKQLIKSAKLLIAQRPLLFKHLGVTVRAVPDLIAFFQDRPPVIVDWKVHVFGLQEAWLQLAVYCLGLTRCTPHKDFPGNVSRYGPNEIELIEVQLLKSRLRRSFLDGEEIEAAETYIAESSTEMILATEGKKAKDLTPNDFAVTGYANACTACAFRACCWEERDDEPTVKYLSDSQLGSIFGQLSLVPDEGT